MKQGSSLLRMCEQSTSSLKIFENYDIYVGKIIRASSRRKLASQNKTIINAKLKNSSVCWLGYIFLPLLNACKF